jgi:hypothetical protein
MEPTYSPNRMSTNFLNVAAVGAHFYHKALKVSYPKEIKACEFSVIIFGRPIKFVRSIVKIGQPLKSHDMLGFTKSA